MRTLSHRSGTLQTLVDIDASTQIPVIQSSLVVEADHDIPEAHISVEEIGVRKRR